MASDERLRELEEKYEGYKVYDNRGDKIGKVDDLFVGESDNEEYIGVKLGLFGTKSTLIPMEIVRVNEAERAIEVSDSKDHVQDAPTFGDDDEVTAGYEDRIRSHFGLESLATSSSRGSYGANSGTSSGTDYDSEESTAGSSGTPTEYRDDEDSREYATTTGQDHRTDDYSSSVDTQYGERTGSSTTSSASSDYDERNESSSGTSAGASGVSAESSATGESTGGQESGGAPASRRTEETETVEEGGRTKVRRRIVREEIIEEEPDS
ncbi:MAG: PRC-barrel domain-containing protein [Rubrobacteraceae bacterium]|nr:PRC-barrel domain-containing protein [Rubrobacteraceae bacterium]